MRKEYIRDRLSASFLLCFSEELCAVNFHAIGQRVEHRTDLGDFVLNRTIKLIIVFDAVDVALDGFVGDEDCDAEDVHAQRIHRGPT